MISKHPASQTIIVHSTGIMDGSQVDLCREKLRILIDEGYRSVIFDFESTPYISSNGLGLLVECHNKIKRLGGMFRLVNCNEQVEQLIQHARLHALLLPDEEPTGAGEGALPYDRLHDLMGTEIALLSNATRMVEQALMLEDAEAIGKAMLEHLASAMHARRGVLFLVDASMTTLEPVHWIGSEPPAAFRRQPLRVNRLEYELLDQPGVRDITVATCPDGPDRLFAQLGLERVLAGGLKGRGNVRGFLAVEPDEQYSPPLPLLMPLVQLYLNLGSLALERSEGARPAPVRPEPSRRLMHLALLGTLAGGVSHHLNNRLVPLMGYTQLLAQRKDLPEDVIRRVRQVLEAAEGMRDSVEKLNRMTREGRSGETTVSLSNVVLEALALLDPELRRQCVTLEIECLDDLPHAAASPELLLEALVVILHCAGCTWESESSVRWIKVTGSLEPDHLRLIVEDSGRPPEAFEQSAGPDPLVEEAALQQGMVFNYAIPRSLVRRLRGKLTVESRPGGGKRVLLDLPRAAA